MYLTYSDEYLMSLSTYERNQILDDLAAEGADHAHYYRETPDGYGCPSCLYH